MVITISILSVALIIAVVYATIITKMMKSQEKILRDVLMENPVEGQAIIYRIHEDLVFDYEHSSLCWLFNDLAFPICDISDVHELQHFLRLCGFNKLADNFKIG